MAGPATAPPAGSATKDAPVAPREPEALSAWLAWLAESTELMLDALRETGPDRGC
ncbi:MULTISPECIES: hypothetical protein [unclassified Streptomyces]|uniref:hypothetical protein n=1 Tax=unclassified Streptomyces TaxID=2593676 RepID=UPI0035DA40EC